MQNRENFRRCGSIEKCVLKQCQIHNQGQFSYSQGEYRQQVENSQGQLSHSWGELGKRQKTVRDSLVTVWESYLDKMQKTVRGQFSKQLGRTRQEVENGQGQFSYSWGEYMAIGRKQLGTVQLQLGIARQQVENSQGQLIYSWGELGQRQKTIRELFCYRWGGGARKKLEKSQDKV